jgi:DNA-binding LacI/PurR family transcriptional regulator
VVTTLRDVAQLAQVSVKTVSNVVNDYPYVSDSLRRRVRDAILELNYRPNLAARNLRAVRTGLLALVGSDTDASFFDALAREVVGVAAARGYRVVVDQLGTAGRAARGGAGAMPVDGLLLNADVVPAELFGAPAGLGAPLVLLGEGRHPRGDRVAVDGARAVQDATEHLLRTGRRRIAVIGARPGETDDGTGSRTVGYRRALRRAGLAPPEGPPVVTAHHRRSDGYRAARALLAGRPRPDGLVCCSDLLAVGAMRAVVDAGLRVPGDVGVIGVGDSEEGRFSRPTLSTVSADVAFIAGTAVDRIVARIGRPDLPPVEITAPHTVLCRESSRAAG